MTVLSDTDMTQSALLDRKRSRQNFIDSSSDSDFSQSGPTPTDSNTGFDFDLQSEQAHALLACLGHNLTAA